ncbi:MAG TPA: N,N-dimethylformamidase beta subunit family domain-containing protein [Actinospica sp.]|nr:N,N-dimethylformamidase beta subunit family domain-containing protein [Actinospica sp.]
MAEISRRSALAVLGAGALAAGTAAAVRDGAGSPSAATRFAAPGPDNPVRAENRLPGSGDWRIGAGDTVGADDLGRQVCGYASATSVNLGGSIDFHVSTSPARAFTVDVYRLGWYGGAGARRTGGSPRLAGFTQPEPVTDRGTGMISCRWTPSWTLAVPRTWTAGAYLAALLAKHDLKAHVIAVNPLAPMIGAWGDALVYNVAPPASWLLEGAGWAVLALVGGVLIFIRREREFSVRL